MLKIVLYEWVLIFIIKMVPDSMYIPYSRAESTVSKDWWTKVVGSKI
jgi:hypothetical protein